MTFPNLSVYCESGRAVHRLVKAVFLKEIILICDFPFSNKLHVKTSRQGEGVTHLDHTNTSGRAIRATADMRSSHSAAHK